MSSAWLSGLFFHCVHPGHAGSQDLKAVWSLSICLLSPPRGIVSRANGQLRGKSTNSRNFSCPSISLTPGVILAGDTPGIPRGVNVIQSRRQIRNASYAVSNLSWSEATDEASKMVHSESVEELSDTPDQPLSAPDPWRISKASPTQAHFKS